MLICIICIYIYIHITYHLYTNIYIAYKTLQSYYPLYLTMQSQMERTDLSVFFVPDRYGVGPRTAPGTRYRRCGCSSDTDTSSKVSALRLVFHSWNTYRTNADTHPPIFPPRSIHPSLSLSLSLPRPSFFSLRSVDLRSQSR